MTNSQFCFDTKSTAGICVSGSHECNEMFKNRGRMTVDAAETCQLVPCSFIKLKFKGQQCCLPPPYEVYYYPCSFYAGDQCGLFKSYGKVWSKCCKSDDGRLAVLVCDKDGIGLTSQPCLYPFACFEYWDYFGGPGGSGGPYAVCSIWKDGPIYLRLNMKRWTHIFKYDNYK
jgi:hypothetical protein